MNINELSKEIKQSLLKQRVSIPSVFIERVIKEMIEVISANLESGNSVSLSSLGTFKTVTRAERTARNPKTNEQIIIPKRKMPVFTPSEKLKLRVVNNGGRNEY